MDRNHERETSLELIVDEYLSKAAQTWLTEKDRTDLLREYCASSELDPDAFIDKANQRRLSTVM